MLSLEPEFFQEKKKEREKRQRKNEDSIFLKFHKNLFPFFKKILFNIFMEFQNTRKIY